MLKSFKVFLVLVFVCATAQAQVQFHRVKKGDNVYRISLKYGVSMDMIFAANPGSKRMIRVGQNLIIPDNKSTYGSQGTYVVKKGETKFGLSKQFGISIAQLEALNPHIKRGLQAGHLLKTPDAATQIVETKEATNPETKTNPKQAPVKTELPQEPENKTEDSSETLPVPTDSKDQISAEPLNNNEDTSKQDTLEPSEKLEPNTHTVQQGETIYSISRSYGVKVQPVVDANPGLDIHDLKVGDVIKIPYANRMPVDPNYYIVKSGDTKESISKLYDLSVRELDSLNPTLSSNLIKGQVLVIRSGADPYEMEDSNVSTDKTEEPLKTPTVVVPVVTASEAAVSSPTTTTDVVKSSPKNSIPSFNNVNKSLEKQVVWLLTEPEASAKSEYFKGGRLAVNKLREEGFKISEKVINVNSATLKELNEELSVADLIITCGPMGNRLKRVRLQDDASILNLSSDSVDSNQFTLNPIANNEAKGDELFKYIYSKFGNVIVINDHKRKADAELLQRKIPDSKALTIGSNDSFNESDLVSLLKASSLNIVVINSNKASVYLNTTNALLRQYANYDVQLAVLNPELVPGTDKISDKRFRILKLLFPSTVDLDQLKNNSGFLSYYSLKFSDNPSADTSVGYEATIDGIMRMFNENGMQSSVTLKNPNSTVLGIDYSTDAENGASNNHVYLYQYHPIKGFQRVNN